MRSIEPNPRNLLAWSEGYHIGIERAGSAHDARVLFPGEVGPQCAFVRGYKAGRRRLRKRHTDPNLDEGRGANSVGGMP